MLAYDRIVTELAMKLSTKPVVVLVCHRQHNNIALCSKPSAVRMYFFVAALSNVGLSRGRNVEGLYCNISFDSV